ncbi:dihydroxyacetone kinase family protein [Devosia sp. A16]|uniref:dihydroxyacetone kinase family protein n=1 Tax=Devosia sp. A16 TaxID=1736675 RepID=UPI0006D78D57|nr:dihydroxyacetone kinase family protein [Devosia sp. A16]
MKKLINDIPSLVRQSLEGLAMLHPGLALLGDENILVRSDLEAFRKSGKVAIVTGGGAGHEPAHAGYVGEGMLTAAVSGDVFASPSTDAVYAALRAVGTPSGVLVIVKNYTGDRLNFGLAAQMARADGIPVELVIVDDDAALGKAERTAGRRGIAGTVLVHKVAGAAAQAGLPLSEVKARALAAIGAVASMGVALSPCTVPAAGKPNFALGDDEMELGLGIHGEAGVQRVVMQPARQVVETLIGTILADRGLQRGDHVALLINNLGGTAQMEMSIVARDALAVLEAQGIVVDRGYCGTFLTAIEMTGISLSLLRTDAALLAALDAPTAAPAWPGTHGQLPQAGKTTLPAPAIDNDTTAGTGPATPAELVAVLTSACRAIIAAEAELTEMDRIVGDGDIGHSLANGANALLARAPGWTGRPLDAVLREIGLALRKSIGGTSGPLYAAFAIAAAQSTADRATLAATFAAGADAIRRLGGADAGDRTMLDALLPAAAAMTGGSIAGQLRSAAAAARAGAAATAAMQPRRGRSSYIGERAIGHPDPGAVAVALWLEAAASAMG